MAKRRSKKPLTKAQKQERKLTSAYNKSLAYRKKLYRELLEKGFVDIGNMPATKTGEFYYKRPKKITEETIKSIRRYNKEYFINKLKFRIPETGKLVSGKEGKKYLKEHKETSQEEWTGNIDALLEIEYVINALPDKVYTRGKRRRDLTPYKAELSNILWTKYNSYETKEEQKEYVKYIEAHKAELEKNIWLLKDSDDSICLQAYSKAADILNRGPVIKSLKKEFGRAESEN